MSYFRLLKSSVVSLVDVLVVTINRNARLCGILLLTVVWLASILVVNIAGNFPLNDDWSFGKTAFTLYKTGQYLPGDWPAMSLISNIVLAIPFIHLFGESFVSLRISSLFYHWLTSIFIFYLAARRQSVIVSTLIAIAVLFSPIPFILSFTFMTEPIFQLLCVSIIFIVVSSRGKSLVLLTAISVIATLSRQLVLPSLLLPFVYNLKSLNSLHKSLKYMLPCLLSGSCYFYYRWWLENSQRMPKNQQSSLRSLLSTFQNGPSTVLWNVQQSILLLGFLLLPMLMLFFAQDIIARRSKMLSVMAMLLTFTIVAKSILLKAPLAFPYTFNVLDRTGFGPLLFAYDSPVTWSLPFPIKLICSVMSVLGGSMVLLISYDRLKSAFGRRYVSTESRLYYFSGILYALSVFIAPMFDRYIALIAVTVMATIVAVRSNGTSSKLNFVLFVISLVFHIGYCLMAGSDYMNIHRTRSRVYDYLVNSVGANPHTTDAGFEFNGLNNYRHDYVLSISKPFWVDDVEYGVGFKAPVNSRELYRENTRMYFGTRIINVVAYKILDYPEAKRTLQDKSASVLPKTR